MAGIHESVTELCKVAKSNAYFDVVRIGAIKGLGYAGGSTARDTLLAILKSSDYPDNLKAAAAEALGHASVGD